MCKHVSYFTQMNKYGGLFKCQERSKKQFLPFWKFYEACAGLFKYMHHGAYKNITLHTNNYHISLYHIYVLSISLPQYVHNQVDSEQLQKLSNPRAIMS